jgi:hypothetical protein
MLSQTDSSASLKRFSRNFRLSLAIALKDCSLIKLCFYTWVACNSSVVSLAVMLFSFCPVEELD